MLRRGQTTTFPERLDITEGAVHDEWELDAQGSMHVAGVGKVCLITVIDVVSRRHRSRAIPALIPPIPLWKRINSC